MRPREQSTRLTIGALLGSFSGKDYFIQFRKILHRNESLSILSNHQLSIDFKQGKPKFVGAVPVALVISAEILICCASFSPCYPLIGFACITCQRLHTLMHSS